MKINYKDIDFEKMWQHSMKSKEGYAKERAFNDGVEREFWKELSKRYDSKPSLYDYSKEVYQFIENLIEPKSSLIEIGPGTGKFTLPLSNKCSRVTGVDFSWDMLQVLKEKARDLNIDNIATIEGKWEEIEVSKADYILSVNSLYRIWDIKTALVKMNNLANKKVIIVRTIQKPLFNDLYMNLGLKDKTSLDYIYMPNILHSLDICADVKYIDVQHEEIFEGEDSIYKRIKNDIGGFEDNEIINDFIKINFKRNDEKFIFDHKTKVEIISWDIKK